jgi:hypothetical protein
MHGIFAEAIKLIYLRLNAKTGKHGALNLNETEKHPQKECEK